MDEKREPLLSDEEAIRVGFAAGSDKFVSPKTIALGVRDFYESKITFGELRVVREVVCKNEGMDEAWCEWLRCPDCKGGTPKGSKYCPGCGAKIKTQD